MALYPVEDYDTVDNANDMHIRFMEVLRKHSLDQLNPIEEWRLEKHTEDDFRKKCICSHDIERNYFISNDFTKTTLVVGSECVNRWLKPKLSCQRCDAVLGSVAQRVREQKFLCRACNQLQKAEAAAQERERQYQLEQRAKKAKRMETLILFWYGPYYKKQFGQVAKDEAYVEYLLNIPDDKLTPTLKAFHEYAAAVWDIEDRPG